MSLYFRFKDYINIINIEHREDFIYENSEIILANLYSLTKEINECFSSADLKKDL